MKRGFFGMLVLVCLAGCRPPSGPARNANPGPAPVAEAAPTRDPLEGRLWLAGIDDPQCLVAFLDRLQRAVEAEDRDAVLACIQMPFRTYRSGVVTRTYRTRAQLKRDYDRLLTPNVIAAIREARYDRLFVRDQGVMIGSGEIWMFDHGQGIRIIAING